MINYLHKLKQQLIAPRARRLLFSQLKEEFDEDWYRQKYLTGLSSRDAFDHYIHEGLAAGNSPNRFFDETFYTSFYPDVRDSINAGGHVNGFHHYLVFGRQENRLAKFDLQRALEARMPGITQPAEIWLIDILHRKLKSISAINSSRSNAVCWFLLPTLNPDIMFGGYRFALELIRYLRRRGREVKIIVCEDESANLDYFLYHYNATDLAAAFADIPVLNRWRLQRPIDIGPNDRIYAYSAWEAHLAHGLASLTNEPRFVFLIQEYEPIFHNYGTEHAIVSAAYNLPHMPIFNSDALRQFFECNRLGVYSNQKSAWSSYKGTVIEHVLTKLPALNQDKMIKTARSRRLVMYARPERHAARNLFALGVLGLRRAIERDIIQGSWEMIGVGALAEGYTIYLPEGYELYLKARTTGAEYAALIADTDLGISLMYAPHPGLVACELAQAGARVVTNTFGDRDSKYLRSISENIIPCDPTVEGIVTGIREAISGLDNVESRLRGAKISGKKSWDDVFDDTFFEKISAFC